MNQLDRDSICPPKLQVPDAEVNTLIYKHWALNLFIRSSTDTPLRKSSIKLRFSKKRGSFCSQSCLGQTFIPVSFSEDEREQFPILPSFWNVCLKK